MLAKPTLFCFMSSRRAITSTVTAAASPLSDDEEYFSCTSELWPVLSGAVCLHTSGVTGMLWCDMTDWHAFGTWPKHTHFCHMPEVTISRHTCRCLSGEEGGARQSLICSGEQHCWRSALHMEWFKGSEAAAFLLTNLLKPQFQSSVMETNMPPLASCEQCFLSCWATQGKWEKPHRLWHWGPG